MRKAMYAAMALLLLGLVHAGTVTFTGTCTQPTLNSNSLQFSISNSGNDTAYNLHITPVIQAAVAPAYSVSTLGPDQESVHNITLSNITAIGSYVDYIRADYEQSSSSFEVVFPCLLRFGSEAPSNVSVSYSASYPSAGTYVVNVTLTNNGNAAISDNVSLILPSGFTFSPAQSASTVIPAHGTTRVSFTAQNQAAGSYSGAAASEYVVNGVHYSAMSAVVLIPRSSAPISPSLVSYAFPLVSAAVVVVLILLIARAYILQRRHRARASS